MMLGKHPHGLKVSHLAKCFLGEYFARIQSAVVRAEAKHEGEARMVKSLLSACDNAVFYMRLGNKMLGAKLIRWPKYAATRK